MTLATNIFQLNLMALSAICITLSVFSFSRLYVYKGMKSYLYFSATCLAISGYVFSQLLLSYNAAEISSLNYHRVKVLFLIIAVSSWYFVIREVYLPGSRFPFVNLAISGVLCLFLPTDLFLSEPVTHLSIKTAGIMFDYRFGKTNICYIIYAMTQMSFPVYCAVKIWRAGLSMPQRIMATIIIIPLFSGFNDYAVTNRIIDNIMIAEFAIFFFAISTFIMLTMEDRKNYRDFLSAHIELEQSHNSITMLKSYLASIIESMPSILIATDREGIITRWNSAAEKTTGISSAEITGKNLWDSFPAFGGLKKHFNEVIEKKKEIFLPKRHIYLEAAREITYYNISMYPLEAGGVRGTVIRIDDVTETERTEELLRQMQKMEIVGTLAGGLAHDFNNILSGIVGTVSIMKCDLKSGISIPPEKLSADIDTIEQVSRRAADLVQQLLTLSHKTEISFAPVDLNGTIKHIQKICDSTFDKSIEMRTHFSRVPAMISADPAQMEQVFLNLFVNAAHAMTIMRGREEKQGGVLTASIDRIFADEHFCRTHPEAALRDYWVLSVQDTGVGISEKVMEKIFDPFYTTKEKGKGTGLGLSMTYKIVQQHGGFIDVYSEEGHGSVFNIYLPLLDTSASETAAERDTVITKGEGLVLVVDDEKIIRMLATTILKECGYSVLLAENGEKALDIFRREQSRMRFVILDMNMPVKSGRETFREMHEIDPEVKVILSSGFQRDEQIEELINEGALDFISKPYTIETLSAMLAKHA